MEILSFKIIKATCFNLHIYFGDKAQLKPYKIIDGATYRRVGRALRQVRISLIDDITTITRHL